MVLVISLKTHTPFFIATIIAMFLSLPEHDAHFEDSHFFFHFYHHHNAPHLSRTWLHVSFVWVIFIKTFISSSQLHHDIVHQLFRTWLSLSSLFFISIIIKIFLSFPEYDTHHHHYHHHNSHPNFSEHDTVSPHLNFPSESLTFIISNMKSILSAFYRTFT